VPAQETEFGNFLKFEPLTLCPYDRKLIVPEMLTCEERCWLNGYHEKVKEVLMPLLANEQEKAWLEKATLAI
jgi:Xaa-Pro aminopeptidase